MPRPGSRDSIEMRHPIFASYMAEILKIPLLTAEAERDLLRMVKEGDKDALDNLVSSHLRFVVSVCWKYRQRGLPLLDLINEGNLALYNAAEHFDLGSPVRFMSYAVWWIRQGVLDALARQAGAISFPPDRMHKVVRYRRLEAVLTQKLGRQPTPDEMARKSGISSKAIASLREAVEALSSTRGFRPPSDGGSDGKIHDWRPSIPETDADDFLLRKTLDSLLAKLKPNEQRIIALRYGLDHGTRLSLAEVGTILGITCERVRQIQTRAITNLRELSQGMGL